MSNHVERTPSPRHWLVSPSELSTAEGALDRIRESVDHMVENGQQSYQAVTGVNSNFWETANHARPYTVMDGTLVIPVTGVLFNKFPYTYGFATGYDYIEQALLRGSADPAVDRIVLDIDSPGGMVMGCFELTDKIYAMRGSKPITAHVGGSGYSAAYAIASAADEIVMTRMSSVGSVGVVTTLMDISKALDKAGVKVTQVFAGKHKVDGNPFEPLPDSVKDRIQARIDKTYGIFVDTVARNRNISSEEVRATEALTFDVEEAIENKFADRRDSDVEDDQNEEGVLPVANNGEESMAHTETETPATETGTTETVVETATVETAAVDTARTEGAATERSRFAAVLASDEYAGREELAMHLLTNTDMDAATITGTLAVSAKSETAAPAPAAEAATPGAAFNSAMATTDNPDVASTEAPAELTSVQKNQNLLRQAREAI